jgi:hypothetical protein
MKVIVLLSLAIITMQHQAAAQLPGAPLPLAVIDELKGVTIKEVLYRNASLYDVCGHLRQVIEIVKPGGAFTNISLVGTKHATAAAVPARITLSDADTSMWETLTNVCQQSNATIRYAERHILLVTSNTLDLPVFEKHISYPLGTGFPAASSVERRVTAELALNHATNNASDAMPALDTDSPLNAQVNIRSTRLPKVLPPRSGEIVYRRPERMPREQVELRGIDQDTIRVDLCIKENLTWQNTEWPFGRWIIAFNKFAFIGANSIQIPIIHIRDPALSLPVGSFRLTFSCCVLLSSNGIPREEHISESIVFEIRNAESSEAELAEAWADAYLRLGDTKLLPDEKSTVLAHLERMNALIKPGTIGNLDFQLAILAIRFNLDEIAYERGIAYLKRGGECHRALLDRLFDIAKRLGRESPTEAMLRLDNANTPTAQQE